MPQRFTDFDCHNKVKRRTAEPKDLIEVSGICFSRDTMVEVPLSQGKVALIDDEDAGRVLALNWCYQLNVSRVGQQEYAYHAYSKNSPIPRTYLHRFILNAPGGIEVDHEDGDGLNCQKRNLRLATRTQNQFNKKVSASNPTGFKGVTFCSYLAIHRKRYRATIWIAGEWVHLGYFNSAEEAARAYDESAREHYREFARLNFPEPHEQSARISKEIV